MRRNTALLGAVALACAASISLNAQSTGTGTQPPQPTGTGQTTGTGMKAGAGQKGDQKITVTGCVQREADYRKAQDKGRGGVAGTGVGAGDEFVLTNASASGEANSAAGAGVAYELTGANEKLAAGHVGHRVEISGTLKAAAMGAGGPTGGATAGAPPRGVDVASKDLRLRELEVATVKMLSADCAKQ
jgi:hypothetical protein